MRKFIKIEMRFQFFEKLLYYLSQHIVFDLKMCDVMVIINILIRKRIKEFYI